ncbi:MAG: F0F1 ATP synthase subunit A, partial [Gaiellaceae bacterium]
MSLLLAAAESDFDPQHEFILEEWIPLHLGPLDLSVNKAVAYIWLGGLATILLGVWLMRFGLSLRPNRRQTTGEVIYDLIQGQIAESSIPSKALHIWFPYVASLFLFIWVLNIIGFIPLPISNDTFDVFGVELPTLGIYAATANLSVTLALALITFFATHVEGIRYNGPVRYFKSWIPEGAP